MESSQTRITCSWKTFSGLTAHAYLRKYLGYVADKVFVYSKRWFLSYSEQIMANRNLESERKTLFSHLYRFILKEVMLSA